MLNIIYRLCENEVDGNLRDIRPPWFSKQKCLKSFLNAVECAKENINEIIFVHDGDGETLLNCIPSKYQIVKINHKSNLLSLQETLTIADNIGGNLYFVEDDYLHFPESIKKIDLALPKYKLLSGYDHASRYDSPDDIQYPMHIQFHKKSDHHWRTIESVCCTYAIEENLYREYKYIIKNYALYDRGIFRHLHSLGIPLWTSIPGIITQVDPYMSPGIDWEGFNNTL